MTTDSAKTKFDEWRRYAEEDMAMAEIAMREDGPPNQICFHAQQIGEKYIKGFLVFANRSFEKSHLLSYLLELCIAIDPTFEELKDDVIFLTQFYIETRYPGDIPEFTLPECRKGYESAVRIKEFVLQRIRRVDKEKSGKAI